MNKNFSRYLATIIIITILTLGLFSVTYYLLSTNYIDKQNGNTTISVAESMSSQVDSKINTDYQKIQEYFKSINGGNLTVSNPQKTYNNFTSENKDAIKEILGTVGNINIGYFDFSLEPNKVTIEAGEFNVSEAYYNYYSRPISFYRLTTYIREYNDFTTYIFFNFGDFFIYTSAQDYLKTTFENSNELEPYYMLFLNTGDVVYQKDDSSRKTVLYIDYIEEYNPMFTYEQYEKLALKFKSKEAGFESLKFNGTKSYFAYSPVLSSQMDDLLIGLSFEVDAIRSDNSYLLTSLLTLSIASVLVVVLFVSIFAYSIYKQNQDLSVFHTSYFLKPFSITINRKGNILSGNKSCYRNIKGFRDYKNVSDFSVDNLSTDILTLIKRQISFIARFKMNDDNETEIRLLIIPMKVFNKYILMGSDVTKKIQDSQKNERIALYNGVTNLPNGNLLVKELDDYVQTQNFLNSLTSVCAVDIVDFARINRLYGYDSGNTLLRKMAEIIDGSSNKIFENNYSIYNIRTSEFVVVFRDVENYNNVVNWSRYAIDKLSEPVEIKEGYFIQVVPKIGMLNITQDLKVNPKAKELIDYTEKALERAMSTRLTKVSMYNSELSVALSRDQLIERDIREAIKNDEFVMYYQPQYNIKTNKIVGYESLLRWNNPKYKGESPEHYVTLAEKNGMIIDLGRLITSKVFSFAKAIEGNDISISLNVSPVQLLQAGFVFELIKSFEEHKLKPGAIALEITETFMMENRDEMIQKLRLLQEKGFSIHLDDFGVGYSSMLYLKDLPVNSIKIDKEFTKYMVSDKTTRTIVAQIVKLAQSLGHEIICEGVETEKQKEILSRMGADIIQGYLISKAIEPLAVQKLTEKYNGSFKFTEPVEIKEEFKALDKDPEAVEETQVQKEPTVVLEELDEEQTDSKKKKKTEKKEKKKSKKGSDENLESKEDE